MNRRTFLERTAAAGALLAPCVARAAAATRRLMTIDLCCGRIGVKASQREAIEYAHRYGFESVEPSGGELANMPADARDGVLADLKGKGLVWGAAALPVDFRGDDAAFRTGVERLNGIASALQRAGVTRIGTWLSPAHDELPFEANLERHAVRLRETARILGAHGLRLGLEYVGPKTSWAARKHPFVHTLAGVRKLIAAIGEKNVGVVLDSWHWYTAHETAADLATLTDADIVAVDLNDAPAGIPVDELVDGRRELPAATGVISVGAFLTALHRLGCTAPVRAEPFNAALREMPPASALAATAAAMKKAFALMEGGTG
ncbi:MAG: TIM barrel protein [Lentisphaerae bacterium]|nr:TIM barrel protein [Lentisphaerota bacterium]